MKRLVKILSLLLALITCFTLVSCRKDEPLDPGKLKDGPNCGPPPWEFYPEGYTGGFPDISKNWEKGSRLEIWWVETYEECLAAIELLKSHGSTFDETYLFSYSEELVDIKYRFFIPLNGKRCETIEYGENPFDRLAYDVDVESFIFLENVSIDDINWGDVKNYNVYITKDSYEKKIITEDKKEISLTPKTKIDELLFYYYNPEKFTFEWKADKTNDACYVYLDDDICGIIKQFGYNQDTPHISDECIHELLKSVIILTETGEIIVTEK